MAYIVHIADAIAIMSGIGSGLDGMLYEIDETALQTLKLDENEMTEIMGESAEYVEKTTVDM